MRRIIIEWATIISTIVAFLASLIQILQYFSPTPPTWLSYRYIRRIMAIVPYVAISVLSMLLYIQSLDTNPGFFETRNFSETLFPWTGLGQVERTQDCRDNNLAVRSVQTNDKSAAGITTVTPVLPETSYQFQAWLKSNNATNARLALIWYTANNNQTGNYIQEPIPPDPIGNTYIKRATAPDQAASVRLFIIHGLDDNDNPVPTSTLCIDDVTFAEVP